jgi:hypothetical protein
MCASKFRQVLECVRLAAALDWPPENKRAPFWPPFPFGPSLSLVH